MGALVYNGLTLVLFHNVIRFFSYQHKISKVNRCKNARGRLLNIIMDLAVQVISCAIGDASYNPHFRKALDLL